MALARGLAEARARAAADALLRLVVAPLRGPRLCSPCAMAFLSVPVARRFRRGGGPCGSGPGSPGCRGGRPPAGSGGGRGPSASASGRRACRCPTSPGGCGDGARKLRLRSRRFGPSRPRERRLLGAGAFAAAGCSDAAAPSLPPAPASRRITREIFFFFGFSSLFFSRHPIFSVGLGRRRGGTRRAAPPSAGSAGFASPLPSRAPSRSTPRAAGAGARRTSPSRRCAGSSCRATS